MHILVVVVILLCLFCIAAYAETETVPVSATYLQTDCRAMLDLVNSFRTSDTWYWNSDDTTKIQVSGLSPLSWSYDLERVAMLRAMECAVSYSHTRPNKERCFTAYSEHGVSYSSAGENIAAGYSTYTSVFDGWREDDRSYSGQGHRRNMLGSSYNAIGISGVYAFGSYFWAMELGRINGLGSSIPANDAYTTVDIEVSNDNITSVGLSPKVDKLQLSVGELMPLPDSKATFKMIDTWNVEVVAELQPQYAVFGDNISISNGLICANRMGQATLIVHFLGHTMDIPVYVTGSEAVIIRFDVNGGSNMPDSISGAQGSILTIPTDTIPVRNNFIFMGWSASPTAVVAEYMPGQEISFQKSAVLYAVWRNIEQLPLNKPINVTDGNIDYAGKVMKWKLTPEFTGVYSVFTTGSMDTYGTVYDENNRTVASDDDRGDGYNFRIDATLQAGKAYTIAVRLYNSQSKQGSFQLTIQRPFNERNAAVLPANTKSIGLQAFMGTSFTAVVCPNGLEQIDSLAFADCKNLIEIRVPESVQNIAADAFQNCGNFVIYTPADSPVCEIAQNNGWKVIME